MLPRPPISPLFPYTTLFRSRCLHARVALACGVGHARRTRKRGTVTAGFTSSNSTSTGSPTPSSPGAASTRFETRRTPGASSDRKSTRLNSSHVAISYAVFCLNAASTTDISTLSLHDALPISLPARARSARVRGRSRPPNPEARHRDRGVHLLEQHLDGKPDAKLAGRRVDEVRDEAHARRVVRSEEHTSELQSRGHLVCRLLLECCLDHRYLHSFPTRRSSDLAACTRA